MTVVDLSDNLVTRVPERFDTELDALPLSRIVRRSAVDEVRTQLVALIESGQLQVNDRLPSEADLSRRFGVSRPIVREALGKLQALGLTESRPGSGTFVASNVTKLTLSFGKYSASDLNEVRRCLEVPVARLAAARRTAEDVKKLKLMSERQEHASGVEEAIRTDSDFHCVVANATGNLLFVRLVEDLREMLHDQTLSVSTLRDRGPSIAAEHRAVLEAIIQGDGDAAASAMEEHLDAVERAIRQLDPKRSRKLGVVAKEGSPAPRSSRVRNPVVERCRRGDRQST